MTTQKFNTPFLNSYRWFRQIGYKPAPARGYAMADVVSGKQRYPRARRSGSSVGKPMANGMQWCNPQDLGLRFVGWQDEIRDLRARDRHKGWLCDSGFQDDDALRGCVYQLPARKGKARFLPAYREGGIFKNEWSDSSGETNAAIHFRDLFSYEDADEAKTDAARAADSFAEHAAEKAREWNDAFLAGSSFQFLGEEITENRATILELLRERKIARREITGPLPTTCKMLRADIARLYAGIQKARKERAELKDRVWGENRIAFNEGSGESIFAV